MGIWMMAIGFREPEGAVVLGETMIKTCVLQAAFWGHIDATNFLLKNCKVRRGLGWTADDCAGLSRGDGFWKLLLSFRPYVSN